MQSMSVNDKWYDEKQRVKVAGCTLVGWEGRNKMSDVFIAAEI